MKKLDEEIRKHFESQDIPQPSQEKLEKLKQEVRANKRKSGKVVFWRRFALACCCLVVILPCILVPTLLHKNNTTVTYYGEDEITRSTITEDYLQQFIDDNYSQYNFIFDDCEISKIYGIYANDTNNLLALTIFITKKDIPFTSTEINLIINNRYIFEENDTYVQDATITTTGGCTLYSKQTGELSLVYYYLLDFSSYKVYLEFDKSDSSFLEKFYNF